MSLSQWKIHTSVLKHPRVFTVPAWLKSARQGKVSRLVAQEHQAKSSKDPI
jgi:hypothetical protein